MERRRALWAVSRVGRTTPAAFFSVGRSGVVWDVATIQAGRGLSLPRAPTGSVHTRRWDRGPPAAVESNRNGGLPFKHPAMPLLAGPSGTGLSATRFYCLSLSTLFVSCVYDDWEARVFLPPCMTGIFSWSAHTLVCALVLLCPLKEYAIVSRGHPRKRQQGEAQSNTAKKKRNIKPCTRWT